MDAQRLPAFNDAKGLEWLDLLRQFEAAGPPNYFSSVAIDTFKEGRVGWIIGGTWELAGLAEAVGAQNLAIDAWPRYGDGALSGYVQAENVYLSANAEGQHQQASLDFIEYFLSAEAQSQLVDIGLFPASTGVQVVDMTTGHLVNQALDALSGGTTYPVVPEMEIYNTQMEIALKSFYDGAPAEQALAAAEGAILEQMGLLQGTPTPTP
jgi:maltose-binding protein MalE